jgi:type I restriction-modification system DNA methylase subunit
VSASQAFLKALDKKLWTAADRLRSNLARNQVADLRTGFVMSGQPLNPKKWWDGKLEIDAHWKYDTLPQDDANFAWVQHMLHHLAPNGSMSSNSNGDGDGDIRAKHSPFQTRSKRICYAI